MQYILLNIKGIQNKTLDKVEKKIYLLKQEIQSKRQNR